MDETPARSRDPFRRDPHAFPARCHPGRPPERAQDALTPAERGDRRYAGRCNPNPPRPPLDDAQRKLASDYLPLARSMARRMTAALPGAAEDLKSAAYLALAEAAQAFDPSRNVHFATFARHRIWGALKDVRRDLVYRGASSPGTPSPAFVRLGDGAESHGRVLGVEPDGPVGADLETLDDVEHWIRKLPRSHAVAFRHIYLDGKTQEEAAALVGCSKSALSRLHSQAMSWLQQTYSFDRQAEAG